MPMKYHLLPNLTLHCRLGIFALLETSGVALQMLVSRGGFPGILLMLGGISFLLSENYNNAPEDQGYADWKPVTFKELSRIRINMKDTRQFTLPMYFRSSASVGAVIILLALLIIPLLLEAHPGRYYYLPLVDLFIITLPLFFSGKIRLFYPSLLDMKFNAFDGILQETPEGSDICVTPYLRFDRDKAGHLIPEDLRFMVELRRNPPDFLGAQFQVAINNGPNGAVPYMYAVLLFRKEAVPQGQKSSFDHLAGLDLGSFFITETGEDEDFQTLVIRQKTTGGGYHTEPQDCRNLYRHILKVMNSLE